MDLCAFVSPVSAILSHRDLAVTGSCLLPIRHPFGNSHVRLFKYQDPATLRNPVLPKSTSRMSASASPAPSKHVLVFGSAGIDLLARVEKYPNPDDKIRTTQLDVLGGGNAANTATCLSRLGVDTTLITKIGDDANGDALLKELQQDRIDVSKVVRKKGMATAFTYVIVDASNGSRTCIHTPAEEDVLESEVDPAWLDNVDMVHFDGRHTLAAIKLAQLAVERSIPIVLDIEKDRPHIRGLLALADYIVTNKGYPRIFAPECLSDRAAMEKVLESGRAKFVLTTRGADGSVMMRRLHPSQAERVSLDGVPLMVTHTTWPPKSECRGECDMKYDVLMCPSWPPPAQIVDTTGAGDTFIGAIVYGLLSNWPPEKMMVLGSYMASCKLTQPGARKGIPVRDQVSPSLL